MARRGHHTLAQIKEMIILAAEELIEEGGLTQLRVRNIASKIGYTVGSIYMVFDSMDELILHLKGRTVDVIVQEMSNVTCHSTEQCLEMLAMTYIDYARTNLNRWSMVFEHRVPESMEVPEWYKLKVNRLHNKFEEQFEMLVPGIPPQEKSRMALAFLGGVHGICVLMLTRQLSNFNENELDESIVLLVRRFMHDGVASADKLPNQHDLSLFPSLALKLS
jgi:AcrR family transcriptional regulator